MMNKDTLIVIPCCKFKKSGGQSRPLEYRDPLSKLIDEHHFQRVEEPEKRSLIL